MICPNCGALLWHYPDGRETCSRCEHEEPAILANWVAIKIVTRENGTELIGCTIGPFHSEQDAQTYASRAVIGSLGYEKWLTRGLQEPSDI